MDGETPYERGVQTMFSIRVLSVDRRKISNSIFARSFYARRYYSAIDGAGCDKGCFPQVCVREGGMTQRRGEGTP